MDWRSSREQRGVLLDVISEVERVPSLDIEIRKFECFLQNSFYFEAFLPNLKSIFLSIFNLVGQRRQPAVLRAALKVLPPYDVPDASEPVRHYHERAEHEQQQREGVLQEPMFTNDGIELVQKVCICPISSCQKLVHNVGISPHSSYQKRGVGEEREAIRGQFCKAYWSKSGNCYPGIVPVLVPSNRFYRCYVPVKRPRHAAQSEETHHFEDGEDVCVAPLEVVDAALRRTLEPRVENVEQVVGEARHDVDGEAVSQVMLSENISTFKLCSVTTVMTKRASPYVTEA